MSSTWIAALAALLVSMTGAGTVQAAIEGPVKVLDGETLEVGGRQVRLWGIDAPEPGQVCTVRGKPFDCGRIAATALMDLTAGASVSCEERGAASGSPVAAVCLADGYDLSQNMVHTGWALADREVSLRYVPIENQARAAGRGLWKGEFISPAEWRQGRRLPAEKLAE